MPRVKIFAGKAAGSYERAKLIIKLANDIAKVVNNDPAVGGRTQGGVFAQLRRHAGRDDHACGRPVGADLDCRHGSMGTGNMKLALNGAVTIGTLDGANVEIREHVGADNMIIFGLTSEAVAERQRAGFSGSVAVGASSRLVAVVDAL